MHSCTQHFAYISIFFWEPKKKEVVYKIYIYMYKIRALISMEWEPLQG